MRNLYQQSNQKTKKTLTQGEVVCNFHNNTLINPFNSKAMKKLLYILAVAFALTASFTACTDENVKPQTNEGGGGGNTPDPKD